MGTRSRAYILDKTDANNHQFKGISFQFDGYPSGIGDDLLKHYNTPEKFNELLDTFGGYVASLAGDLETTKKENANCEKSDLLQAPYSDPINKDSLVNRVFTEWCYLMMDGKWYFFEVGFKSDDPESFAPERPHGELLELTEQAIEAYRTRA